MLIHSTTIWKLPLTVMIFCTARSKAHDIFECVLVICVKIVDYLVLFLPLLSVSLPLPSTPHHVVLALACAALQCYFISIYLSQNPPTGPLIN